MYAPLRLSASRAAPRTLVQRRLLNVSAPVRNAPTPAGTATPNVKPKKSFFRRLVFWTATGAIIFYPASAWLSTRNEAYRDIFTQLPGGEELAEYADEHRWDQYGVGTLTQAAMRLTELTGGNKEEVQAKLEQARKTAEAKAAEFSAAAKAQAAEAQKRVAAARDATVAKAHEIQHKIEDKTDDLKHQAGELKDKAAAASDKAADKASEAVSSTLKAADKAVAKVQEKAQEVVNTPAPAAADANANRFPDTQRARELRPETVQREKPTYEGQEQYKEQLPLGFEPPPGYYLLPPPPRKEYADGEPLPLLVPMVKSLGGSEPVVAQLATTIDSLTTSLSSAKAGANNRAAEILDKAQSDLAALNKRIEEVKATEEARLKKAIESQADKFQDVLAAKEAEWQQDESSLKQTWEAERQKMVDGWREVLDAELATQREVIEKRLHEEVVSQGIELQRRWLRSIKSQVEVERGGRFAKLDALATSLKQLERITLDNSAVLDDNVRLHKIWSALRAVQSKADKGDVAFDDELRVLQALAASDDAESVADNTVIRAALSNLEHTGVAGTGVKSFASLSSWFSNSVAPRVHEASLVPSPENAGVMSHLASMGLSKLLFRPKAGLVDGNDVGAVLARAEYALGDKDLDAAAREINSLRGWPKQLAADWLREARRRLEVEQALSIVGTEATLSSLLLV